MEFDINKSEIWKQIPFEVKLEMLTKSHSRGVRVGIVVIVVSATLAIVFPQYYLHCKKTKN